MITQTTDYEAIRQEFIVLLRDPGVADRFLEYLANYSRRSLYTFRQVAEMARRDLAAGKSQADVMRWLADIV